MTASTRILFVTVSLDLGGTERHLATLAPELVRRGWSVAIYCTNRLGAFAAGVAAAGVEVIGPPLQRVAGNQPRGRRFLSTGLAASRLFATIRRFRPDIAHFFLPEPYLVGAPAAIMLGVPIRIMSRRGLNFYQQGWPGSRRLEQSLHGQMSAILANSRRVVSDLVDEGCERAEIGLIYNGVGLNGLDQPVDGGAVRRRLGIDEASFVAIVVANLIAYKGHADLIDALHRSRDRLPEPWTVLCVGRDESQRAKLEELTRDCGLDRHVRFLGERNDIAELLLASDVAISSSHEEGFSNSVLEGMAAGLPLIVTDVGGNAEAVLDRETGLVVPARDPARLSAAIVELANDASLRRRYGAAGLQRVRENFSLSASVDKYEAVYRGLQKGLRISQIAELKQR